MVFKTQLFLIIQCNNTEATTRAAAITAEALAKNNRWCSKHSYFNNTDAITAEATTRTAAITAETLARTTADGLQNTAISNNTDAITAEATIEQMHSRSFS
jgi:hypothetical protein